MTARDPLEEGTDTNNDENKRPVTSGNNENSSLNDVRRRDSMAQSKPALQAPAMPATSFYGTPTPKQPLRPPGNRYSNDGNAYSSPATSSMQVDSKPLDLDGVDSIPTTPDANDIQIEDVQDTEEIPRYQPTELSFSGWPDPNSMRVEGHGQLPASLLGKSKNPAFSLGNGFRAWDNAAASTEGLRDYQIKSDFSVQVPATNQAQSPQKKFSYSQAAGQAPIAQPAGSGNPSQMATPGAGSIPKLDTAMLVESRPHPHAFYNVKTHAWTVITPYPDHSVTPTSSISGCPGRPGAYPHTSTAPLKSHHYVRLSRQVDPRFILRPSEYQAGLGGPTTWPLPNPYDSGDACWTISASPADTWWDLYVCSQCRNSVAVSPQDVVPSYLGKDLCERFVKARTDEATGNTNEIIRDAIDYIWKVLRNVTFKHETSAIPQEGTTFTKRMGKSDVAVEFFRTLGFTSAPNPKDPATKILHPPQIVPRTMLLLSRAMLELSIWSASLHLQCPLPAPAAGAIPSQNATTLIQIAPGLGTSLEAMFGADDSPAYTPSANAFIDMESIDPVPYKILGITPETSNALVVFAYERQIVTDPELERLPLYFEALQEINTLRGDASELQIEVAIEQSKGRYTSSQIQAALRFIGVPGEPRLETFFGRKQYEAPDEDQLIPAWEFKRDAIIQSQGTESDMKELRDAVNIIVKTYQTDMLEAFAMSTMDHQPTTYTFTADEAYARLSIDKTIDDATLCSAATFWLGEASGTQKDKMIASLQAIAEARNSDVLRKFIETGDMPLPITSQEELPASLDRPAGLQNIGNTCYLNSLLQYFFTIRELREIVLNYEKYQEDDITEELLQRKRVGGRQVTAREIERSKKFVAHLSTLFMQLIHSQVPAVRPELDLAYLALVSTKDEDQATSPAQPSTTNMAGIAASSDVAEPSTSIAGDTTMVEDQPASNVDASAEGLAAAQSHPVEIVGSPTSAGSPSVLGKRNSEHLDEDRMEIDGRSQSRATISPEKIMLDDNEAPASKGKPSTYTIIATPVDEPSMEGGQIQKAVNHQTTTIDADQVAPPPLPPRPEQHRKATTIANSNMMFGKQNDVSEAMDNVIFQIEVALNDDKIPKASANPNSSLSFVQSLFYGTTRQTLDFEDQTVVAQRTKEETFSYLLVDVASEGRDLYDGLDASLQTSQVEVEGKLARRNDILTTLPPILQIQLQRVQFDRKTSKVFKSNAYMPFPPVLKMSRYMAYDDTDPVAVEKHQTTETLRQNIAQGRVRLAELEQVDDEKQSATQILRDAEDALQQAAAPDYLDADMAAFTHKLQTELKPEDGDMDVLKELLTHAEAAEKDITEVKGNLERWRSQMESVWEDDHDFDYELSSVFIHLGAAGYGHYYLYQRALPSQPERWLKFNDSTVTDVPSSEVFADTRGATANPYWLSYVRKSDSTNRIDAVCRQF